MGLAHPPLSPVGLELWRWIECSAPLFLRDGASRRRHGPAVMSRPHYTAASRAAGTFQNAVIAITSGCGRAGGCLARAMIEEVGFAADSLLEGGGFEPSAPSERG